MPLHFHLVAAGGTIQQHNGSSPAVWIWGGVIAVGVIVFAVVNFRRRRSR
jgi:hypothetical protein